MQAIQTWYRGPTASRAASVRAVAGGASITILWEDESAEDNHRRAARELCEKLGWTGELVTGVLNDGSYAHVFTGRKT